MPQVAAGRESRVFVTGATGYVGRAIIARLLTDGHEVVAWRRPDSASPDPSAPLGLDRKLTIARGALFDVDAMRRAASGCDAVVHLAADLSYRKRDRDRQWRVNVGGTAAVMAMARGRRIAHLSTVLTRGPARDRGGVADEETPYAWAPGFGYAESKAAGERVALDAGATVVLPATIYGPGSHGASAGRVEHYLRLARKFGAPSGSDTVVYVDDAIDGIVRALWNGTAGRSYIVGGDCVSFAALLARAAKIAGGPPPRRPIPGKLVRVVARALEATEAAGVPVALSGRAAWIGTVDRRYSSARASRELGYGWRPYPELLRAALAASPDV